MGVRKLTIKGELYGKIMSLCKGSGWCYYRDVRDSVDSVWVMGRGNLVVEVAASDMEGIECEGGFRVMMGILLMSQPRRYFLRR